jgi:hypothetical protein
MANGKANIYYIKSLIHLKLPMDQLNFQLVVFGKQSLNNIYLYLSQIDPIMKMNTPTLYSFTNKKTNYLDNLNSHSKENSDSNTSIITHSVGQL